MHRTRRAADLQFFIGRHGSQSPPDLPPRVRAWCCPDVTCRLAGVGQTVPVAWSGRMRFGAVDVHYPDTGGACAALVVAGDKRFADLVEEHSVWLPTVEAYQPGK